MSHRIKLAALVLGLLFVFATFPNLNHPSVEAASAPAGPTRAIASVGLPELTIGLTDNAGGPVTLGNSFNWVLSITNSGVTDAVFADGQTIVFDQLPNTSVIYGSPVPSGLFAGPVVCSLDGSLNLNCTANGGPVTIPALTGTLTVTIPVTPQAGGTFTNPRVIDGCSVDPDNAVAEEDETNNFCSPDHDTVAVNAAPQITSADNTTFFTGTFNTFTVTTTGGPTPSVSESGALPSGVTFTPNGDGPGTGTLSGTPDSGTEGTYPLVFTAANDISPSATQNFTLTVTLSAADLTATKFNDTPTGTAGVNSPWTWEILIQNTGTGDAVWHSGENILTDNLPGTNITYTGPTISTGSPLTSKAKAFRATTVQKMTAQKAAVAQAQPGKNGAAGSNLNTSKSKQLGPTTSDGVIGQANILCTLTTVLTCSASGGDVTLQAGGSFEVSFHATATAVGTYANPTGGICRVNAGASTSEASTSNNSCADIVQVQLTDFGATLGDNVSGSAIVGTPFSWSINVSNLGASSGTFLNGQTILQDDLPISPLLTYSTPLYTNGGGVTGTVNCAIASNTLTCLASGNVTLAANGSFTVSVPATASNNGTFVNPRAGAICMVDPANAVPESPPSGETDNACVPASDTVTASGAAAPHFTSLPNASFVLGQFNTFTITTTGVPTPAITMIGGTLPSGVGLVDNHDGTATLSGTPGPGTLGSYSPIFKAANGIVPDATQNFTLTVTGTAPAITSPNNASFPLGQSGSFTVTTTGNPAATISVTSGTLPFNVTLTDNGNGTATIAGIPAPGTFGPHTVTLTAANGVAPPATQSFTLNVTGTAPAITSANATTFVVGVPGTFTVTATGNPAPAITRGGVALPANLSFTDNGNGTGTLSGIPAAGTAGTYALTFTASSVAGTSPTQSFTLTILLTGTAPQITSPSTATFMAGVPNTFTVTSTGNPMPILNRSASALPPGVIYTDNGNGTGTLSGTPTVGTSGNFPMTFTATNGLTPNAVQQFTLVVNPAGTPPTISKTFAFTPTFLPTKGLPQPKPFGAGDVASLSFTLKNQNPAQTLTGIAFTDNFPAGLVVAMPNGLTGGCGGGAVTAVAGSAVVSLSGATLTAGQTCTFSVNVTVTSGGNKVNTTGAVTANESGPGGTATATLLVGTSAPVAQPLFSKAFLSNDVALNTPVTLRFTITNTDPTVPLTGVAFSDQLPAGILVATPNGLSSTGCGAGLLSAASGLNSITLANGTIAGGATCTINVNVIATATGPLNNISGTLTTNETGAGAKASATLRTAAPPGPPPTTKGTAP